MRWLKKKVKDDDRQRKTSISDLWLSYQDEFEGFPISVKVNIKQINKQYLHTLYVMIPYFYSEDKPFPDARELVTSQSVKNQVDGILNGYDHIKYIGSTIYGGNIGFLYVSNDQVDWLDLIQVNETVKVGMYKNDMMHYSDKVMYPPHIRRITSESNKKLDCRA